MRFLHREKLGRGFQIKQPLTTRHSRKQEVTPPEVIPPEVAVRKQEGRQMD